MHEGNYLWLFGKSESMYIVLFLQINSISNFTMFFTHQPSNPTPNPFLPNFFMKIWYMESKKKEGMLKYYVKITVK